MEYSILSDIGSKRGTNQDYADSYVNRAGYRLFLLADGMGGHKAGNVASKLTVEDLGKLWSETFFDAGTPEATLELWLRNQIRNENENIASLGKLDEYQGMGTTLEAVVIKENVAISAHVGDSRTYLIRDGALSKVTTDHSLVQELVDAGQITEEEAEVHPNKNIITRSLGQTTEVQADIQSFELQEGDVLLMNSDGLTNMVSAGEILEIFAREDLTLDNKSEALIRLANEHGGFDNITVILIKFDGQSETEVQEVN
ncbi:Stp1/IreP family PP2C-type Ser/Thr phosphatase [Lactococcus allomyrinae]|uniref:protein-serine/threonine phosphatase n=1 Tax=Lactococcus allomyrinae TaxID=2419773 RepID=A0A387BAQ6_9LACT|nr:Stp1/IreP family PP2C-type Ser/Thr phosphatase [Lactococcus allomyrinae]AYG00945.1 Stp1/IreP family PP2C-type Ser/Thr phosphatase [Lactococcus allomyrinae]